MKADKFTTRFANFLDTASRLAKAEAADAIVLMIESVMDWSKLKKKNRQAPVNHPC